MDEEFHGYRLFVYLCWWNVHTNILFILQTDFVLLLGFKTLECIMTTNPLSDIFYKYCFLLIDCFTLSLCLYLWHWVLNSGSLHWASSYTFFYKFFFWQNNIKLPRLGSNFVILLLKPPRVLYHEDWLLYVILTMFLEKQEYLTLMKANSSVSFLSRFIYSFFHSI